MVDKLEQGQFFGLALGSFLEGRLDDAEDQLAQIPADSLSPDAEGAVAEFGYLLSGLQNEAATAQKLAPLLAALEQMRLRALEQLGFEQASVRDTLLKSSEHVEEAISSFDRMMEKVNTGISEMENALATGTVSSIEEAFEKFSSYTSLKSGEGFFELTEDSWWSRYLVEAPFKGAVWLTGKLSTPSDSPLQRGRNSLTGAGFRQMLELNGVDVAGLTSFSHISGQKEREAWLLSYLKDLRQNYSSSKGYPAGTIQEGLMALSYSTNADIRNETQKLLDKVTGEASFTNMSDAEFAGILRAGVESTLPMVMAGFFAGPLGAYVEGMAATSEITMGSRVLWSGMNAMGKANLVAKGAGFASEITAFWAGTDAFHSLLVGGGEYFTAEGLAKTFLMLGGLKSIMGLWGRTLGRTAAEFAAKNPQWKAPVLFAEKSGKLALEWEAFFGIGALERLVGLAPEGDWNAMKTLVEAGISLAQIKAAVSAGNIVTREMPQAVTLKLKLDTAMRLFEKAVERGKMSAENFERSLAEITGIRNAIDQLGGLQPAYAMAMAGNGSGGSKPSASRLFGAKTPKQAGEIVSGMMRPSDAMDAVQDLVVVIKAYDLVERFADLSDILRNITQCHGLLARTAEGRTNPIARLLGQAIDKFNNSPDRKALWTAMVEEARTLATGVEPDAERFAGRLPKKYKDLFVEQEPATTGIEDIETGEPVTEGQYLPPALPKDSLANVLATAPTWWTDPRTGLPLKRLFQNLANLTARNERLLARLQAHITPDLQAELNSLVDKHISNADDVEWLHAHPDKTHAQNILDRATILTEKILRLERELGAAIRRATEGPSLTDVPDVSIAPKTGRVSTRRLAGANENLINRRHHNGAIDIKGRLYQREFWDLVEEDMRRASQFGEESSDHEATLAAATGAGKTHMAIGAMAVRMRIMDGFEYGDKFVITSPFEVVTTTLIKEVRRKFAADFKRKTGRNLKVTSVYGGREDWSGDVVVVSIPTVGRKGYDLKGKLKAALSGKKLAMVVLDEIHHEGTATTWPGVRKALRAVTPDVYMLGLTATPTGSETNVLMRLSALDLMKMGVAPNPEMIPAHTGEHLTNLRDTGGDFNRADLSKATNTTSRNTFAVSRLEVYKAPTDPENVHAFSRVHITAADRQHAFAMAEKYASYYGGQRRTNEFQQRGRTFEIIAARRNSASGEIEAQGVGAIMNAVRKKAIRHEVDALLGVYTGLLKETIDPGQIRVWLDEFKDTNDVDQRRVTSALNELLKWKAEDPNLVLNVRDLVLALWRYRVIEAVTSITALSEGADAWWIDTQIGARASKSLRAKAQEGGRMLRRDPDEFDPETGMLKEGPQRRRLVIDLIDIYQGQLATYAQGFGYVNRVLPRNKAYDMVREAPVDGKGIEPVQPTLPEPEPRPARPEGTPPQHQPERFDAPSLVWEQTIKTLQEILDSSTYNGDLIDLAVDLGVHPEELYDILNHRVEWEANHLLAERLATLLYRERRAFMSNYLKDIGRIPKQEGFRAIELLRLGLEEYARNEGISSLGEMTLNIEMGDGPREVQIKRNTIDDLYKGVFRTKRFARIAQFLKNYFKEKNPALRQQIVEAMDAAYPGGRLEWDNNSLAVEELSLEQIVSIDQTAQTALASGFSVYLHSGASSDWSFGPTTIKIFSGDHAYEAGERPEKLKNQGRFIQLQMIDGALRVVGSSIAGGRGHGKRTVQDLLIEKDPLATKVAEETEAPTPNDEPSKPVAPSSREKSHPDESRDPTTRHEIPASPPSHQRAGAGMTEPAKEPPLTPVIYTSLSPIYQFHTDVTSVTKTLPFTRDLSTATKEEIEADIIAIDGEVRRQLMPFTERSKELRAALERHTEALLSTETTEANRISAADEAEEFLNDGIAEIGNLRGAITQRLSDLRRRLNDILGEKAAAFQRKQQEEIERLTAEVEQIRTAVEALQASTQERLKEHNALLVRMNGINMTPTSRKGFLKNQADEIPTLQERLTRSEATLLLSADDVAKLLADGSALKTLPSRMPGMGMGRILNSVRELITDLENRQRAINTALGKNQKMKAALEELAKEAAANGTPTPPAKTASKPAPRQEFRTFVDEIYPKIPDAARGKLVELLATPIGERTVGDHLIPVLLRSLRTDRPLLNFAELKKAAEKIVVAANEKYDKARVSELVVKHTRIIEKARAQSKGSITDKESEQLSLEARQSLLYPRRSEDEAGIIMALKVNPDPELAKNFPELALIAPHVFVDHTERHFTRIEAVKFGDLQALPACFPEFTSLIALLMRVSHLWTNEDLKTGFVNEVSKAKEELQRARAGHNNSSTTVAPDREAFASRVRSAAMAFYAKHRARILEALKAEHSKGLSLAEWMTGLTVDEIKEFSGFAEQNSFRFRPDLTIDEQLMLYRSLDSANKRTEALVKDQDAQLAQRFPELRLLKPPSLTSILFQIERTSKPGEKDIFYIVDLMETNPVFSIFVPALELLRHLEDALPADAVNTFCELLAEGIGKFNESKHTRDKDAPLDKTIYQVVVRKVIGDFYEAHRDAILEALKRPSNIVDTQTDAEYIFGKTVDELKALPVGNAEAAKEPTVRTIRFNNRDEARIGTFLALAYPRPAVNDAQIQEAAKILSQKVEGESLGDILLPAIDRAHSARHAMPLTFDELLKIAKDLIRIDQSKPDPRPRQQLNVLGQRMQKAQSDAEKKRINVEMRVLARQLWQTRDEGAPTPALVATIVNPPDNSLAKTFPELRYMGKHALWEFIKGKGPFKEMAHAMDFAAILSLGLEFKEVSMLLAMAREGDSSLETFLSEWTRSIVENASGSYITSEDRIMITYQARSLLTRYYRQHREAIFTMLAKPYNDKMTVAEHLFGMTVDELRALQIETADTAKSGHELAETFLAAAYPDPKIGPDRIREAASIISQKVNGIHLGDILLQTTEQAQKSGHPAPLTIDELLEIANDLIRIDRSEPDPKPRKKLADETLPLDKKAMLVQQLWQTGDEIEPTPRLLRAIGISSDGTLTRLFPELDLMGRYVLWEFINAKGPFQGMIADTTVFAALISFQAGFKEIVALLALAHADDPSLGSLLDKWSTMTRGKNITTGPERTEIMVQARTMLIDYYRQHREAIFAKLAKPYNDKMTVAEHLFGKKVDELRALQVGE